MRVTIAAIGRARDSAEALLVADYLERFNKTGRALHLGPAELQELDDRKGGGQVAQAALLENAVPDGAVLAVLDERGKGLTSPEFAQKLAGWRDDGRRDVAFVIGGADGVLPSLRKKADFSLSFGRMVWPHMLARVMLAEQLYRAAAILAGTPYHRV